MRTVIEGLEITQFGQYEMIQDETLADLTITHQSLAGSHIKSSTYTSVNFSSCVFFGCHFEQVTFENCHFRKTQFDFSHFKNCKFIDCTFEECNWQASSIRECSYTDCELDPQLSGLTESHFNLLHFTFAEREKAREVELMLAASFTAA
jgi:uncharacterized protein YjbI with pentapeptide repeats